MLRYGTIVLPATYLAPARYYSAIINSEKLIIDGHENFVKQTIRSRCEIYGANGKQLLSVPVEKRGNHIAAKDVKISYKEEWQKNHWRSLVSAYRNSAYFEYYVDEFEPYFSEKREFLFDLNMELFQVINNLLKVQLQIEFSEKYIADYKNDISDFRTEKTELPEIENYYQLFEERHGFISGLSILDLLFNYGPDAKQFLLSK